MSYKQINPIWLENMNPNSETFIPENIKQSVNGLNPNAEPFVPNNFIDTKNIDECDEGKNKYKKLYIKHNNNIWN